MDSGAEFQTTEACSSAAASLSHSPMVVSRHESLPLAWGLPYCINPPDEHQTVSPLSFSCGTDLDQDISRQLLEDESDPHVTPTHLSEAETISMSPAMMFLATFSHTAPVPPSPDAEGEIVRGYTLGPMIGYGGFSIIRRATSSSGDIVAVKIVRRSDLEKQTDPCLARKRLNHEAQVWASLNHEHMLPLFFAEHTPSTDFFFTLLCPAGSLYDILIRDGRPSLPHDEVGRMFRQIVQGVRYLHEIAGYVHRDIKLENVLVDEMGVCRISDFGLTRKIGEVDDSDSLSDGDEHSGVHRHRSTSHSHTSRSTKSFPHPRPSTRRHVSRRHRISTIIGEDLPPVHPAHAFEQGSLPYASPELLQPQDSRFNGANPAQDIWALGVLLYALLTGRLPFFDSFEPRLQMKILHGVYDMPSDISHGATLVLKGCLERCVRSRWTIAMVDDMAWGVGWQQVDDTTPVSDKDQFEFIDYPSHRSSSSNSHSRSCAWHGGRSSPLCGTETSPTRRSNRSVSTGSSLSTRCTSRSISRPPIVRYPLSPTYDELRHSLVSASPSLTVPPLDIGGSDLIASPGPSLERGRRPKKDDFTPSNRFTPSLATSSRPSRDLGGDLYTDVDTMNHTAQWASNIAVVTEDTNRRCGTVPYAIERLKREAQSPRKNKRAESTPPASGLWPRRARPRTKEEPSSSQVAEGGFLREPSAAPLPITPKSGARSRSVGYDTHASFRHLH